VFLLVPVLPYVKEAKMNPRGEKYHGQRQHAVKP
jgi:hypothetical protein